MSFEHLLLALLGIVGSIVSFLWAVYQWKDKSDKDLLARNDELKKLRETRQLEASKPFLEKQLALYTEITQVVSALAAPNGDDEYDAAERRFWKLYWGELTLVEDKAVAARMVQVGLQLKAASKSHEGSREVLKPEILNLTSAIRASLDRSWNVNIWTDSK